MSTRLAYVLGALGVAAGAVSLLVLASLPSPLTLCQLSVPPQCISAVLSGRSYISGDSQASFLWPVLSLVLAPVTSLGAVFLAASGRRTVALILAAVANLPGTFYVTGTYALIPFHVIVFTLTILIFVAVATRPTSVGTDVPS